MINTTKNILLTMLLILFSYITVNANNETGFDVDTSPQPSKHPSISPVDGNEAILNPPSFIWRFDKTAATYILELSQSEDFQDVIRVKNIDMPFYNHSKTLSKGNWYWRYFVVRADGKISNPSQVRTFVVSSRSIDFPVPTMKQILEDMPGHPRIFTTPEQLSEFRNRSNNQAKQAWEEIRLKADKALRRKISMPKLVSIEQQPEGPTRRMEGRWKQGDPVRRQVFFVCEDEVKYAPDFGDRNLASVASRAHILSLAYLISGEARYAKAAKQWLLFTADGRVDYHLPLNVRASHDTVVYAYETGLKSMALAYDWIYDYLDEQERQKVLDHIKFHCKAAYEWLRDNQEIHLNYQISHPQQCMHALLPTVLAVMGDLPEAKEWADYLIRQYANRIAWTSDDGGYFEGQTYAHKFRWILESLVAMRTATGIDVFRQPRISNSGHFWLYCMSLNYWFHHGGDVYSLLWPWGNPADGYISNLLASMTDDPYVQWWADTVFTDPTHIPLQYLSQTSLKAKPPVDISQAKAFLQTGQLSAYDKFYDHLSNRIFFRSSPWGGHSHSHADQNNFVIHAGGEILAGDVGYYTYYGDAYDSNWSKTTKVHNSILVNGEGQPKNIESKGKITNFYNCPDYTFFIGDASQAYEEPMRKFKRAIAFVRPDVYVVYDQLEATAPSEFSWLLNTFDQPDIDRREQIMTVPQQHMRMDVEHLLPRGLSYESSNERRYPIKDPTKPWSRYTEAFPEPWHTRVNTPKARNIRILALMNTYDDNIGRSITTEKTIENHTTAGVLLADKGVNELVMFRRSLDAEREINAEGFVSDAVALSAAFDEDKINRFFFQGGSFIEKGDWRVELSNTGSVYGSYENPSAAAMFWIESEQDSKVIVPCIKKPVKVTIYPAYDYKSVTEADYKWQDGLLEISVPNNQQSVVSVDPVAEITKMPASLTLETDSSKGKKTYKLETAVCDNGEWIAFAKIDPPSAGTYSFSSNLSGNWLIQDRWTHAKTVRGNDTVTADWREGAEVYFRFAPSAKKPALTAKLVEPHSGDIINYLRNGGFEEGIPHYQPRGWTVNPTTPREDTGVEDPREWAHWTQEDSRSGKSALKMVSPKYNIVLESQPMRLLSRGHYKLRFWAKGDPANAKIIVRGSNTTKYVNIKPIDKWRKYEQDLLIEPGMCRVIIELREGGHDNQTLWVDDMEFGPKN